MSAECPRNRFTARSHSWGARLSADIGVSIDDHDRFGAVIQRTARRFDVFKQSASHLGDVESINAAAALSNTPSVLSLLDIIGRRGSGNG